MSDLISRQDAIDALDGIRVVGGRNSAVRMMRYIEAVRDRLKQLPSAQPTIDAVEVVRCRDCKHWNPNGIGICKLHDIRPTPLMMDDWFCADGARMDGEEKNDD